MIIVKFVISFHICNAFVEMKEAELVLLILTVLLLIKYGSWSNISLCVGLCVCVPP